jgi:hypothetical protein
MGDSYWNQVAHEIAKELLGHYQTATYVSPIFLYAHISLL